MSKCKPVLNQALTFVATWLRLARLTTLLVAANRKASWNKAIIWYKCCAFRRYLDLTRTDEQMASPETQA